MKQIMKKTIAALMTITLLLSAAVIPMSAEDTPRATEGWGVNASGEFTIGSVGDMLAFMKNAEAATWYVGRRVRLTADIDMTGVTWTQVPSFRGVLEGDGHYIKGMNIQTSMFGNLGGGTVRNLRMIDGTVNIPNGTGAVFAVFNFGSPVTFENVYVKMNLNLPAGKVRAAGFIAYLYNDAKLTFKNCVSECTFTGGGDRAGGFVAQCGNTNATLEMTDCVSLCDLSAMGKNCGGLVAHNDAYLTMTRCLSLGKNSVGEGSGNLVCLTYQGGQKENKSKTQLIDCYGVAADETQYAVGCNKATNIDLVVKYGAETVYSNTETTKEIGVEADRTNLEAAFRYIAKGDRVSVNQENFKTELPTFNGWVATDETVAYGENKNIVKLLPEVTDELIDGTFVPTQQGGSVNTNPIQEIFDKAVFTASDGYKLNYRIYVPDDYSAEKEYPLVLFFHGAGSKGNENENQLNAGVPQMFANPAHGVDRCIVIAPQCPLLFPDTAKWVNVPNWVDGCTYSTEQIPESVQMKAVVELLGEIRESYSTDENRWYVTGLSMGGFATWDIIVRHPELWAAAVPVCGGADYRKAEVIKDLPIWTFHGLKDPTVPYRGTEKMVNELKAAGSTKIKYTEFPEGQHNIWTPVYSTAEVYEWLFAQVKSDPAEEKDPATTDTVETGEETTAAPENPETSETAPSTDAATDDASNGAKPGCGSVAGAAATAILATAGAAVTVIRKKKENE